MHFAFPPRKTSHPPAYARRNNLPAAISYLRNPKLRLMASITLGAFALLWLLLRLTSGSQRKESIPHGTPGVVVVTILDADTEPDIRRAIVANRKAYAEKHGYATFFPNSTDYVFRRAPLSWSLVPSLRHAMTLYPHTPFVFYLSRTALIMNTQLSIEAHLMGPQRLESLMIVDQPIVPPDSVIKTFSHLRGDRVDFVLAQDDEGLTVDSLVLRRGDWAKYFLDAWFDPLYRSYNFQKAELHALEHLVQWHGTILAKMAIVPQRILNAYPEDADEGTYAKGDFVVNCGGCEKDGERSCAEELRPWIKRLKLDEAVEDED